MSLATLKATVPLVPIDSVDPGDERELAVAANALAVAILEVEALVGTGGGTPITVVPLSTIANALGQPLFKALQEVGVQLEAAGITGPVAFDLGA